MSENVVARLGVVLRLYINQLQPITINYNQLQLITINIVELSIFFFNFEDYCFDVI